MQMNYWLFKSEPSSWSWADQLKKGAKGEGWDGNQGAGLVHRSPHAKYRYKRLYMTIDYDDLFFSIYKKNKRFLS